MKLKPGVKLRGLVPQMVVALLIIHDLYAHYGVELVVTSANDSQHKSDSFHYAGQAVDLRTKTFQQSKALLVAQIKEAVGPDFDVLLENEGTDNEHLHIEYDPKDVWTTS